MAQYLEEALAMREEIVAHRRYLHQHAELGFELTETVAYVCKVLRSYGCEPRLLGGGVTCTIGQGTPVILLRADMDALPQEEQSGLDFACRDGACHPCGHDAHTSMLLAAAKLLKVHETELAGTVKLCFQPAEELLKGSQAMIDAGILDDPKVDAAIGFHMNFGDNGYEDMRPGVLLYAEHQAMASADEFQITVKGASAHGSTPFRGVSAAHVASAIVTALQQLLPMEVDAGEQAILSVGSVHSGSAANIVPAEAVIKGSFRTFSPQARDYLRQRLPELAGGIASAWRAEAETEYTIGVAPNVNDEALTQEMVRYASEVMKKVQVIKPVKGSEDFANLCGHVPTFFANICAGGVKEGYIYSMHNPKARLDEDALPYGAALHATCAANWLSHHKSNAI